ncbi:MAG TPA: hypothetical protein VM123_03295 [archaeon]|nr:hypothetical protein [archaeon]
MQEKVVLIGAGSAVFTCGMVADLIRMGWEAELSMVDIDPVAIEVVERLGRKMIEARRAPIRLRAATDRREVLSGATAVICTVGVGGRRAWEQDVFIPRKYGIYQPVGDTVMPGGTSRAMRMIPAMVGIARDVLELAPKALFFNYSNPMGPVCRAVRKATGAEVVGLCHGVLEVAKYLAGVLGVSPSELDYTAAGLNHLTWFTGVRVDRKNAMGRLQEIAREKLSRPRIEGNLAEYFLASGSWEPGADEPEQLNPFSWELLAAFGAFPAAMDRHVTEFFPWIFTREGSYYGKTLGTESYSFERTIARGDKDFEQMREDAFSPSPLGGQYFERISGEHEQVMEIIESIRTDAGRIYSANLPNRGQVSNLPSDAILESPAAAGAGGLKPLDLGALPSALAGILAMRLAWIETCVEAALEGSREKFIQALVLDGAVKSVDQAVRLADELLAAQAEHLPWLVKKGL